MALSRYNAPVIRDYISKLFELGELYVFTQSHVADLTRPHENVPAGVVDDIPLLEDSAPRIRELIDNLETNLLSFEAKVPEDITSQRDIADLLSDVRCYIELNR